jgi:hypothetical protein
VSRAARGWLVAAPTVVVSLELTDLTETELRQEILKLRRRVEKLAALLRLTLALLHTSGFSASSGSTAGVASACRDRQLLATDSGVAGGRHVRTGEQRSRAARGQSGATRSVSTPVVLADAGAENVNAQVDALIDAGVLRRLLAFTELKFSNSMIEAWWYSLKIG